MFWSLRFRRKSDFHPKKDLDDESIGKTDRFLLSMTHRRRKSEGHIEPDSHHVCSCFTYSFIQYLIFDIYKYVLECF